MTDTRSSQLRKVLLFLFVALFYVFTYTVLHEGGHAIIGLLAGARISAFNVNFFNISAHVSFDASFTRAQAAVMNVAGVSLPFMVWLAFILSVPRRSNLVVELIKTVSAVGILNVFLVWMIFPVMYLWGTAPSDDVTNFLTNSGIPPLLVAGVALLVYLGGWILFLRRIDGIRGEIDLFITPGSEWMTPAVRRSLGVMAGLLVVLSLAAFTANGFRLTTPPRGKTLNPPAGYSLKQIMDLSSGGHASEPILSFTLSRDQTVGIFLLIADIDTGLFDVYLAGPDEYTRQLIHAEGYSASLDSALLEEKLPAGHYQLILTSQKSPGTVSIYTSDVP